MVKLVSRRRTQAPAPRRLQIEYLHIDEIIPYEYNPRDNEKAIPAVAESIRKFGFLVPCIVDDNNVLVAGHTRTEGARSIGITDIPCIRASHLTQEQVNAFRLIDNKVAEQAAWDFDLLAGEISKLGDAGIDWVAFGWTQEEVDCLSDVVASDCLEASDTASNVDTTAANQNRRSPTTARVVIGELVFFVTAQQYRLWVDGLRQLHDFNEVAITNDIKQRLGLLE